MTFDVFIFLNKKSSNTVTTLEATDIITATKNEQNNIFSNSISQWVDT